MQDRYVEMLIEKVKSDRYPSGGLMDRIEGAIGSKQQAAEYLEVLYDKVDDSRYPSGQLLDRIERTTSRVR